MTLELLQQRSGKTANDKMNQYFEVLLEVQRGRRDEAMGNRLHNHDVCARNHALEPAQRARSSFLEVAQ